MKPRKAAAHMIISGASLFAEQPDVLCLCVCVCARVRQVKPEHRKKNRGVKVSPCTNLKPQKHTHTCAV